jgi:pyruvate dehydrogenase E1 component
VHRALGDDSVPVVAVSDYVSALPDSIARFIDAPYVSLGTDGYGLSDTREELRAHFGTDTAGITDAAVRLTAAQRRDQPLTQIPAQTRKRQPLVA